MEVKILEETKNKIRVTVEGANHTLCNALASELQKDSHVNGAGYLIEHPLKGIPEIIVETDGADPKKIIFSALKKLNKQIDDFKKAAKSISA
jgi:DNA-directed RNA polymerase subunit L